jgi:hypothetical protein
MADRSDPPGREWVLAPPFGVTKVTREGSKKNRILPALLGVSDGPGLVRWD